MGLWVLVALINPLISRELLTFCILACRRLSLVALAQICNPGTGADLTNFLTVFSFVQRKRQHCKNIPDALNYTNVRSNLFKKLTEYGHPNSDSGYFLHQGI